jgi:hypothetical protein
MRRAQLLSLDALMATVLVIMLLSVVSATSDNLRAGITDMINWYDRTSVPSSMLDVLLGSPGKPANWSENVSLLQVPGLRADTGQYVDYNKLVDFVELIKDNDTRVVSFMRNISLGRPFLLNFYLGRWQFNLSFSWTIGPQIPPGYTVYNGSCTVANTVINIDSPTIMLCPDSFSSSGSTTVDLSAPLCVRNPILSSGSLVFQPVTPSTPAYLALSGNITSSGSLTIYTNLYLKAPFNISSTGSISIQPPSNGYVIVYGGTPSGALNLGGAVTIDISANLYVQVDNTWYASNETDKWYEWTGSSWVPTSIPPGVSIQPLVTLTISGYPLPQNWNPPAPPACFNTTSSATLNVTSLAGNYSYPQQLNLTEAWNSIAQVGGSLEVSTANVSQVFELMKNASWVSYSERHLIVGLFRYNSTVVVSGNTSETLLAGTISYPVPAYSSLEVIVPNETGYILLAAVGGTELRAVGVWKSSATGPVRAEVWTAGNTTRVVGAYVGTTNSISIPWEDVFGSLKVGQPILLYMYSNSFTSPVTLVDTGNIGMSLGPLYQPLVVKLWVWDES